ncbi:prepilin-type N-terminal cleavage/methylation domain-containing protein [Candidatus Saccharibacteria bacterium]|nr:prepilin-type N-terminal cleavage/methylation domain-containing protein [Candidatus Saccharibacteria bacterium]
MSHGHQQYRWLVGASILLTRGRQIKGIARYRRGFTIVELLIVIVVIGILAAISIVAYSGIQDRARYSSYRSDIGNINKAIMLYAVDNGAYPTNGVPAGGVATNVGTGTGNFISGLTPTYLSKIPDTQNWSNGANYYAYIWSANGANYKIIRVVPSGSVPAVELIGNIDIDPTRGNRSWGYWSAGGSGL